MWEKQWLAQFPEVSFAANDNILTTGDPLQYNYYLIDGICAKMQLTPDGEELILYYYKPGKMLGVHLNRYGQEIAMDFRACTPCRCYRIPHTLVQQKIRSDNDVCYFLLQESMDECDFWANSAIAHMLGGGISVLCLFLQQLAVPQPDGTGLLHPMFTNVTLSKYCGLHTVSISRLLSRLHREGILARSADGIRIYDMERLANYIKTGE